MIEHSVYARVGLAGNPSDGFDGKTLSACVRNWRASVSLKPTARKGIRIEPNGTMDPPEFRTLAELAAHTEKYGHYGALRLIQATCALFYRRYQKQPEEGYGFTIKYHSSIPRQVGLGGSSAIVVALLHCLMEHCGVDISLAERAHFACDVENEELGITAGLQDRVVQTYGGLVYMDFSELDGHGYGRYEQLPYILPEAFIAYTSHPRKNSGQVHNPVRYKFQSGDEVVKAAMKKLAKIAEGAKSVLENEKHDEFGHLMEYNLTTRLELYGKEVVGEDNMKMFDIAHRLDCPAKLPGSGGAVVGLCKDGMTYGKLRLAYETEGFQIVKVIWDQ